MGWPGTIVFDLDGTLVDSAPDLTAALNVALADAGRPPVDPATVRHLVGHGARALIERGLALSGGGGEAEVARALPVFLDHYAAHVADGTRPYHGCEAALDALAARGATLAICTNKPVALSRALIAALGWTGRFAANLGGDFAARPQARSRAAAGDHRRGRRRPRPAPSSSAIPRSMSPRRGRPACRSSPARFGFADRPAAELGADAVIDAFAELDGGGRAVRRVTCGSRPSPPLCSLPRPSPPPRSAGRCSPLRPSSQRL